VLDRALQERVVVWQDGAWQDGAWQDGAVAAQDGADRNAPSYLAAPLIVRNEVAAVVYLESLDAENRFDEGHLQLLTAVAGMAAVAWENATILGWLQEENVRLQSELRVEHGMVGVSDKLHDLQRQIAKVAPSNSNVLILGESGTGKELIARALHRSSLRAAGPFVAINCAALTETLLESELFGHERGAFTGAITQKKGKLEVADGGTVFLDEIGELSPLLQAKLLRVLQEREMERVGGTKTIQLNIRLLAATEGGLPPRSLLPLERGLAQSARSARSPRGHLAAGRALRQEVRRRVRPQNYRLGAAGARLPAKLLLARQCS
jgi:Nif-specific regulatory protein